MPENEEHPLKKKLGDLIQEGLAPNLLLNILKQSSLNGASEFDIASAVLTTIVQDCIWPEFENLQIIVDQLAVIEERVLLSKWGDKESNWHCILCGGQGGTLNPYLNPQYTNIQPISHSTTCPWLRAKKIVGGE